MIIFFLFLAATIIVIFGSHAFIGFTAVKLFGLQPLNLQIAVYAVLEILALAFVASALLLHWRQNEFLRFFYYSSSLWLGLAMQLILASVLGWLIIYAFGAVGRELNRPALGAILIIISLGAMIFGVFRANQIAIKTIAVKIPGLPEEWKGKIAVQVSDIHIGAINQTAFMEKQAGLINSLSPDVIFLTGDYFDGSWDDFNRLAAPLNELKAPWGIYFVTGNHEVYDGVEKIKSAFAATPVKILNDEKIDLNGVQIAGASYPENGLRRDIGPVLAMIDPSRPSIFLYHEPVPAYASQAKKAGVNLMLSGHTHAGQVFPVNFITRLLYRGLDYGLHRDGNFNLYTSSGLGTWGPPIRTTVRPEIVKIIFE